ncbi:hypothetical protein V8G54_031759 [Vigna mungo]|uniref:Cysteine-rich transmembrane domain-containing protein n=1 Tax=Vigna mungo TaxID=3915 RepID=A0AAQ3MK34_VIGMU
MAERAFKCGKLKNCLGLGPPSILDFECASKASPTERNKSVAIRAQILWPIKIISDRTFSFPIEQRLTCRCFDDKLRGAVALSANIFWKGPYQGPPPVAAPPQYYAAPPPRREPGFLEGCLAALCCCCLLDECCCDPTIIFAS